MTITHKFQNSHKNLVKRYELKRYKSILAKRLFVKTENENSFEIHDLIEKGYLEFLSQDIRYKI